MKERKKHKNMPKMFHSSLPQHRLQKPKVVKSRYHLKKVFFPVCAVVILLAGTCALLNYPIVKEHIEFLIPKNQYLIYGFAGLVNLFMIIYCGLAIREYFTLKILLKEDTLKVKHYTSIRLDLNNVDEVTLKQSLFGKMLGYATITILNRNRSVLRYVDIINGAKLRRAIKKIQSKHNQEKAKKGLFHKSSSSKQSNSLKLPIKRKPRTEEHSGRKRRR